MWEREPAGWRVTEEAPNYNLSVLRQFLVERLSDEELRELCFELRVDYESLGGEGKEGIARELILYLDRRQHIPELVGIGKRLRPDIPWDEAMP